MKGGKEMNLLFDFLAQYAFELAVNSVNLVSAKGVYQPEIPASLQKYQK